MSRINDKIDKIREYLSELEDIRPESYEEYIKDKKTKAACERYFEVIVEAVVDLAFLIIKVKGLRIPEDDKKAFDVLADEKIISKELASRLKDAKGMRNIIAHEYGTIDNEIVFEAVAKEIISDANDFIGLV